MRLNKLSLNNKRSEGSEMNKKDIESGDVSRQVSDYIKTRQKSAMIRTAEQKYERIIGILDEKIRKNGLDKELVKPQTSYKYILAAIGFLKGTLHIVELNKMLYEIGFTEKDSQIPGKYNPTKYFSEVTSNPAGMCSYLLQSAVYFRLARIFSKAPHEERINMYINLAMAASTSKVNKKQYREICRIPVTTLIRNAGVTSKQSTTMITYDNSDYYTKPLEERQRGFIEFEYSPSEEEYSFLDVPEQLTIEGKTYYPRIKTVYGKNILHIFTPAFVMGVVKGYIANKNLNPVVFLAKLPVTLNQINDNVYLDNDGFYKYKDSNEICKDKKGESISYTKSAVIDFMGHEVEINSSRVRIELAHDREKYVWSPLENFYYRDVAKQIGKTAETLTKGDLVKYFLKKRSGTASLAAAGTFIYFGMTAAVFGRYSLLAVAPVTFLVWISIRLDFKADEKRRNDADMEMAIGARE